MRGREKASTACFSGHRPEKLAPDLIPGIRSGLSAAVKAAVSDGMVRFISGMSRGVDMWAAEAVLALKAECKNIELECALPFNGQERLWDAAERESYHAILARADIVSCLSPQYTKTCMFERNHYMIDQSSLLIACYDGSRRGGTAHTCKAAMAAGIRIINLYQTENDNYPLI